MGNKPIGMRIWEKEAELHEGPVAFQLAVVHARQFVRDIRSSDVHLKRKRADQLFIWEGRRKINNAFFKIQIERIPHLQSSDSNQVVAVVEEVRDDVEDDSLRVDQLLQVVCAKAVTVAVDGGEENGLHLIVAQLVSRRLTRNQYLTRFQGDF